MSQEANGNIPDTERSRIVNRLRRLAGQVRGLQSMVAAGKECEPVLTQIMAVKSALNQVSIHIIGHSMKQCVREEGISDVDSIVARTFEVFSHYRTLSANVRPSDITVPSSREEMIQRLGSLESDIDRITELLSSGADCEVLVAETTVAIAAVNEVALATVGHSMKDCIGASTATDRDAVLDEAVRVFLRYSACIT